MFIFEICVGVGVCERVCECPLFSHVHVYCVCVSFIPFSVPPPPSLSYKISQFLIQLTLLSYEYDIM